ncbi:hypothetical protein FQA39_LY05306 [Lamprigera yunnana]|nr:hypothetical protein FQA39_LY05306 [Lamprigera yunnana]
MKILFLFVFLFVIESEAQRSSFHNFGTTPPPTVFPQTSGIRCPEKNGRFPTNSCDGYIECENGIGVEKLCPDGLLFNAAAGIFSFPCQYPVDVNCVGREARQSPQATEDCPHQYGYFRIGDAANCGQFKNCVDGRGYVFDCPEGLAFNGDSLRCDWPDEVPSCDAEAYLGFTCPPDDNIDNGLENYYRSYSSPVDCQKYFICVNSKPRLYNCGEDKAYNELINACDGIENVTRCAHSVQPNYLSKKSSH